MQCSEFENRLNELLDQRLDPASDQALARHAGHCGRCEQDLSGWLTLAQQLPSLELSRPHEQNPLSKQPVLAANNLAKNAGHVEVSPAGRSRQRRRDRQTTQPPHRPALLTAIVSAAAVWCGVMLWPGHSGEGTRLETSLLTASELPTTELAGNFMGPREATVAHVSQKKLMDPADGTTYPVQAALVRTIDFDRISANVSTPHWWGSMMVAAWKPVDPLTTSIRPLTESFQTALQLLTPRSTPATSTPPSAAPEDAAVDRKRFLASIA
ncbi:anti-sigma factor family protein [Planctomycetaceae bacterium SH139]